MGLNIAAFRKLRPIDRELTRYGVLVDGQYNWKPITAWTSFTREEIEFTDRHWPGGSEGIMPGQLYTYVERRSFRAYGGYTRWRLLLHEFASANSEEPSTARRAFTELMLPEVGAVAGKFVLRHPGTWLRRTAVLIDSLGVIGPTAAGKLAQDFAEHQERADTFPALRAARRTNDNRKWLEQYAEGCGWLELYCEWRKSLEMAADDGAIQLN